MKIQIVSDLHMEFAPIELTNAGADVLVLSGDIIVADYFARSEASPLHIKGRAWINWFERTCAQFDQVFYVLGNHEHYKGRFYETVLLLNETLGHIRNLAILDNTPHIYGDVLFFGTTLWTDFGHDNYKAMMVRDALNDYKLIQGNSYRKLSTAETAAYHAEALKVLNFWCDRTSFPVVVVGHHAPSYCSITPEYATGRYAHLNTGYASNLDNFIGAHPKIALWTHGHVHSSHDYMIGSTRIVANPRGYDKGEGPENKAFDPNLIVEI